MMNQPKPKFWYYKILRVAMKELQMTEEEYRDFLEHFGAKKKGDKISATTMSVPQLETAFSHLKRCGFKIKRSGTGTQNVNRISEGQIAKIKKLWHLLFDAGVMRTPYSDAVAVKFAAKHTGGIARLEWAKPNQLNQTIEALKSMAKRGHVAIEND